MKAVSILLLGAVACWAGCFPVSGGRITGRDLALANAAFSALPAAYTVALAPEPGARVTLAAAELNRIAAANHIVAHGLSEICFEIPMRRISEQEAMTAMRSSLPENVEIQMMELPQTDEPRGELQFPLNGLEPPAPDTPAVQLWRGFVRYADTRRAQYWARVRIVERYNAAIALRDLPANVEIPASAIRVEERTGPVRKEKLAAKVEEVAGHELKRAVKQGDPVPMSLLTPKWDVKRGDPVRVEVTSGEARLQLDAIAETPAREGDFVELRNPASGKSFRARLAAGAKAVLVVPVGPKI